VTASGGPEKDFDESLESPKFAASMARMDASQSALDSLRTVEFRETLKGYHRDDVDEYLEKAAVEAEGLQEQLRQSGERLRQAAERISQLETALEQQPTPQPAEPAIADDTLQRTLILAQQFVDKTKQDAEAQAARTISDAESAARKMTEQAQSQASQIASESEHRLRDEIGRLEESRSKLTYDIETMSRHLDGERTRLRSALGDILRWIDDNVKPVPAPADGPAASTAPSGAGSSSGSPNSGSTDSSRSDAPASSGPPSSSTPASNPTSTPAPSTPAPSTPATNSPPTPNGGGSGMGREMTQVTPSSTTSGSAAGSGALPGL
jgi:DivIVA domain-containing protein